MNKVAIDIQATIYIEKNKLKMYNVETGESKTYDQISQDDLNTGLWVTESVADAMRDAEDADHYKIDFTEIDWQINIRVVITMKYYKSIRKPTLPPPVIIPNKKKEKEKRAARKKVK